MARVSGLTEQWDEILAAQPDDWSTLNLELRLRDATQSEECALICSPLNPWRDGDWRTGVFRFRVARTFGYGSAPSLAHRKMQTLDKVGIRGTLRLERRLAEVRPVATQGPL
jgi:hypothetical protein